MADVEISVQPHEVVLGERALQVRSTATRGLATSGGEVTLTSARADVQLSDGGRTATLVPDEPLAGAHTLVVGEVVSPRGERVSDRIEVPFFVSDSIAKVDPAMRIEGIVRLKVDELSTSRVSAAKRPDGPYIELMKAVDRGSGTPVELAFDERGARIDAAAVFAQLDESRRARFGKLHPALHDAVRSRAADDQVPVAIWMATAERELPSKRERGAIATRPRAELAHAKRIATTAKRVVAAAGDLGAVRPSVDPHAPVVYATLPAARVRELERRDDVAAIYLHETEGINDLKDSIAIAQSDTAQSSLGVTGKGVNVAVYEDGPKDTSDLQFAARYDSTPPDSDHARLTSAIIKNVEPNKPHGHAPGCNLHSANSYDLAALDWAMQHNCTVVSQSFHRDSEQTDSGLSFDDRYKDWLILHYPYPTIVQAAGNGNSSEFVNHKGYNSITVASHDDSAASLASDSVFRNPSSSHGDRELPEISANGIGVSAVSESKSGTSFAAPAVAGAVALIQERNATLKSWPEGCRAILFAAASKNITGSTWWDDRGTDAHDGAGALDSLESVQIAGNRRTRNTSGTRRGWDIGTLRSADIGASGEATFSHHVTVPRLMFRPRVKVALAWDSFALNIPFFSIDQLLLDLDLKIYDSRGALVGYSGSYDNSYEIAEFAAARGQTYTIKIRRWSGTADVWYGIAWTVTGGFLIGPVGGVSNGTVLQPTG